MTEEPIVIPEMTQQDAARHYGALLVRLVFLRAERAGTLSGAHDRLIWRSQRSVSKALRAVEEGR